MTRTRFSRRFHAILTLGPLTAFIFMFAIPTALFAADNSPAQSNFRARCATCHGPDGHANTPVGKSLHAADLHSAAVQKLSNAELVHAVSNGKGNMPPFGGILSKDQIEGLVKYVRTLKKK